MKKTILIIILSILFLGATACNEENLTEPSFEKDDSYSEVITRSTANTENEDNTAIITGNPKDSKSGNETIININDLIYQYPYKFIQKNIPTEDEQHKLSFSFFEPFLTKKDNKLFIDDYVDEFLTTFSIGKKGEYGYLLAGYYGEFGRYLYYIALNELYEVDTYARDFYVLNHDYDTIYCVYSVSMWYPGYGIPRGMITRITKANGKWQRDERFEIHFAENEYIYTFYAEDDTVYVVTDERLIKITNNKLDKVLVEDAFWGDQYPNSIVRIDDTLYIGMRGGIASYNLETGKLLWYERVSVED